MPKNIRETKNENRQSITFSVSENVLVQSALGTLEVFHDEIRRICAKCDEYKGGLDNANAKLDEYKSELDKATTKRDEYKGELDKATAKLDEYKSELDKATAKRDEYKGELDKATAKRDEYKSELDKATAKRDEYKGELDKATVKRDEYKGELDKATAKRDEYKAELDEAIAKRDEYNGILTKKEAQLYTMIQNGMHTIAQLLPELDDGSLMNMFIEEIKNKGDKTNNKGLSFYSQYQSVSELAASLKIDDSALSMIANLIWWNEQPETKGEIINKIENIDSIALIFRSQVLIPLELSGYKVNLPTFGLKKDEETPNYKNSGNEDQDFKGLFETKLETYSCWRFSRLSYNDIEGVLFEYY